ADDALDLFLVFSSTAGVFGNVGQADYAFANAFLDAWTERRAELVRGGRRRGRSVSIAWPLWAEGGMPVGPEVLARLAQAGLRPLPTAEGLRWLELLAATGETRVLPLWGERARILATFDRAASATSSTASAVAVQARAAAAQAE